MRRNRNPLDRGKSRAFIEYSTVHEIWRPDGSVDARLGTTLRFSMRNELEAAHFIVTHQAEYELYNVRTESPLHYQNSYYYLSDMTPDEYTHARRMNQEHSLRIDTLALFGFTQEELNAIHGYVLGEDSPHFESSLYLQTYESVEELEAKRIIPRAIEKRITARPDLVQEISEAFWKMDNKEYIETARSIEAFDPKPSPREAGLMLTAQKIRKGNPRRKKRR